MNIKALILDMDGVLWRGNHPIGDLPAVFEQIARLGLKVVLATNNSTLTVEQYQAKLLDFGVHLLDWQIVTSAEATAHYLHHLYPQGGYVHIVGEDGLLQALQKLNFISADDQVLAEQIVAVVAGMDRKLTYEKLSRATLLIRAGTRFIGTNPDRTFPVPQGLVPGAGSILALLETASDVKPYIIGKPALEMYRVALERLGTLPDQTLVVGDRLETDIAGAQEMNCPTALVLSGVTTLAQATDWHPAPNLIAPDLASLLQVLA